MGTARTLPHPEIAGIATERASPAATGSAARRLRLQPLPKPLNRPPSLEVILLQDSFLEYELEKICLDYQLC